MSGEAKLVFRTAAGVKVAEVTDYLSLAAARRVNEAGLVVFTLNGDHPVIALLEDKGQIDVVRRDKANGIGWYTEMTALLRKRDEQFTDRPIFEGTAQGVLQKLAWRHVAWYAGTDNRSQFASVAAETIMKTLVEYNAGASATTANGRLRTGTDSTLAIEADGGGGTVLNVGCAWDNLLDALQAVANKGGGDFDLVRTAANTFEFRWFAGQRGTDRRSTVRFSVPLGNMANPRYIDDRLGEATVAIVGGQGQGELRDVVVVTGADYAAGNEIETFINGPQTTTAGLTNQGEATLYELQAVKRFTFDPVQTPSTRYGLHYFLGDLVTATFGSVQQSFKVQGVALAYGPQQAEQVAVELMKV